MAVSVERIKNVIIFFIFKINIKAKLLKNYRKVFIKRISEMLMETCTTSKFGIEHQISNIQIKICNKSNVNSY